MNYSVQYPYEISFNRSDFRSQLREINFVSVRQMIKYCTPGCQCDIFIQNVQINHPNVFYNQYFFVLFFDSETNFSWISHKLRLLVWLQYETVNNISYWSGIPMNNRDVL